ncbi:hypothetical protein [Loigolactobacillus bifermentans]|uniref:Phage protein n=1 Tax=Loigolactobacillus bifermentans DSM 20003 TaxID=1423726 RepID=A0A0R1H6B0_9LACO|nr:hypothetical protein [Loigolactobacillus bifermentans]KRK38986.1 hypothetical protein FC07_GL002702 [Loigolactobacillus bifermentans DSM 20003]QGG59129.1 phage gp6-like head-tail connector protein [Loigolactobacillus bifermentans]
MADTEDPLLSKFKQHIEYEEGMDDSMFDTYLKSARSLVKVATGWEPEQSVLMIAAMLNDWRVPDSDMQKALDAMTPILLAEGLADHDETAEPSEVASNTAEAD